MSDLKWFAMADGVIQGPFKMEELETRLGDLPGALIWGKGMSNWLPVPKWRESLAQLDHRLKTEHQRADRQWRLLIDGQESKPMNHEQMIQVLRTKTDLSPIRIWTEGYNEWKEIYQIHKIMDELGVSRRTHPRVPIMGTIQCESESGPYSARLLSISQGGLGATESPSAKIGEKFKITLKSPNLSAAISATVEIVYLGVDGYFGMKFLGLQTESKGLIIEYIRKFSENPGTAPS